MIYPTADILQTADMYPTRDALPPTDILGVRVSALTLDMTVGVISDWIAKGAAQYVCVTGVHGIMESQREPELRDIHNQAGLVTPDGMPLVWLSRLAGKAHVERVYGPDLMEAVCRASGAHGYRHFFYGGGPGVADALAARLQARFPGLAIAGTYTPPFRSMTPDEDTQLVTYINDVRPDIVWVGLSTPKQERWMAAHIRHLRSMVLIGVGAAFDFHAGVKRQAPCWMQRSGLEWCFRLMLEPRRLWRRYLLNNPQFVWRILCQTMSRHAEGSAMTASLSERGR